MAGVAAGAALGRVIAGIMGATAYVYGYSTILEIPIFQKTILAVVAAIITAILVAAAVTFVLGFDESEINLSFACLFLLNSGFSLKQNI